MRIVGESQEWKQTEPLRNSCTCPAQSRWSLEQGGGSGEGGFKKCLSRFSVKGKKINE